MGLRFGAAVFCILAATYAGSAAAEGALGLAVPTTTGDRALRKPPKGLKIGRDGLSLSRASEVLARQTPESQTGRRGATEMRVYQAASPSVVLVVSDDALGSGALISADGKIITNLHVVGDEREVGVVFKPKVEGAEIKQADLIMARVIRRDEIADLALLQVSKVPEGLTPLKLGGVASIQVGSDVHAIGHPTGESWTYTRGVVSQVRKDYVWSAEDDIEHKATVIQTQTPINPGNSGGPLLDDDLEIVGVNSFKGDGEGLNFAVSADDVKAFLDRKSDRRIKTSGKKAAAAKACEPNEIDSWTSKKDKTDHFLMDLDCDGKGDYVVNVPDKEDDPISLVFDVDHDGKIDTIIFDDDRDGHPDFALYDDDGDGTPEAKGEYKDGEDEPYRIERLDPEDLEPKKK